MKRVLVADDDSVVRKLIARALRDLGIAEVCCAPDGKEALALLSQHDFHLVVLDWHMPLVKGLEVVRVLRGEGSRVPVIMVTAEGGRDQILEAINAGVTDYVVKPLDYELLRQKLRTYCRESSPLPNVQSFLERHTAMIQAGASIPEAATALLRHRVPELPVVNERNQFVGVITEAQLLSAVTRPSIGQRAVRDVMRKDVVTVDHSTSLDMVLKIMLQRDLSRIPILRDGQLAGVVTRSDLLRHALPDVAVGHCTVTPGATGAAAQAPEALGAPADSSAGHSFLSVESYSEAQTRGALRVLETLDRLDARTQHLYGQLRKHVRYRVRRLVTVGALGSPDNEEGASSPTLFRAWTSSLSSGGLAFIYPGPIHERRLLVGVPLADEKLTWFRAEIVRERELPDDGFWEFGVAFWDRVSDISRPASNLVPCQGDLQVAAAPAGA